MIKSFRGNSLVELDKEVNDFLQKNSGAKVINFTATQIHTSVPKIIYIYIVEFEEITACSIEEAEFQQKYGL